MIRGFRSSEDGFQSHLSSLLIPSSGVTPVAVTGGALVAWLKADSLALSNGASVTSWPDSSIWGNTAVPVSSAPTFATNQSNGLPAIRFTASSGQKFQIDHQAILNLELGGHIFAVVKQATIPALESFHTIISKYDKDSGYSFQCYQSPEGLQWIYANVNNTSSAYDTIAHGQTVSTTSFQLVEYRRDSTNAKVFLNNIPLASISNQPAGVNTKRLCIGGFGTFIPAGGADVGREWDGWIAEIMVFDSLSETQALQNRAYLSAKYALGI